MSFENETWIIDEGDRVIEAMTANDVDSLSPRDRVIYFFWVADYSFRNAGDLETAYDVDSGFRSGLEDLSATLPLPHLRAAIALSDEVFCETYDDWFDSVCEELRSLPVGDGSVLR